jgi:hypothetical protein
MLSGAPASVLVIALLGMLIVAFAVTRMTLLERKRQRPLSGDRNPRYFAGSGYLTAGDRDH